MSDQSPEPTEVERVATDRAQDYEARVRREEEVVSNLHGSAKTRADQCYWATYARLREIGTPDPVARDLARGVHAQADAVAFRMGLDADFESEVAADALLRSVKFAGLPLEQRQRIAEARRAEIMTLPPAERITAARNAGIDQLPPPPAATPSREALLEEAQKIASPSARISFVRRHGLE